MTILPGTHCLSHHRYRSWQRVIREVNVHVTPVGASFSGAPHFPDRAAGELWLRFLSGPDIDSLGVSNAEIVAAVEGAVRAHGDGRAVVEPRVHLVPDNNGAGHFNVLRGHLPAPGPLSPGPLSPGPPTPVRPRPA